MIQREDWYGIYRDRWNPNDLTGDSMGHPAKFARGLIRKIYSHCTENGWIDLGDYVIDPFGGVGLGALDAMLSGFNYVGIEIEQKHYDNAVANIEHWNNKYGRFMSNFGSGKMINGDSRNLVNIHNITDVSTNPRVAVSSPPFRQTTGGHNVTSKSGVLADSGLLKRHSAGNLGARGYGDADGNLANMAETKDGFTKSLGFTDSGYALSVSSPPYGDIAQSGGTKGLKEHGTGLTGGEAHFSEYGEADGQIGRMRVTNGGYSLSVSSPPFMGVTSDRPSKSIVAGGLSMGASSMGNGYGETPGQLAYERSDDFWIAARQIADQLYSVIEPGGHVIWVCKKYVKGGKLVNFDRMWAKVCTAAGFCPLHWHRAWVVETINTQYDLSGNKIENKFTRKSFFRMLAERKGSPRIDWETVICMEKPRN